MIDLVDFKQKFKEWTSDKTTDYTLFKSELQKIEYKNGNLYHSDDVIFLTDDISNGFTYNNGTVNLNLNNNKIYFFDERKDNVIICTYAYTSGLRNSTQYYEYTYTITGDNKYNISWKMLYSDIIVIMPPCIIVDSGKEYFCNGWMVTING